MGRIIVYLQIVQSHRVPYVMSLLFSHPPLFLTSQASMWASSSLRVSDLVLQPRQANTSSSDRASSSPSVTECCDARCCRAPDTSGCDRNSWPHRVHSQRRLFSGILKQLSNFSLPSMVLAVVVSMQCSVRRCLRAVSKSADIIGELQILHSKQSERCSLATCAGPSIPAKGFRQK